MFSTATSTEIATRSENEAQEIRTKLDVWLRNVMPQVKHRFAISPALVDERYTVETAKQNRQQEFQLGRNCANELLMKFGLHGPVEVNRDRSPGWPTGTVGSISHSSRWTWAALGLQSEVASIGIDTEPVVTEATRIELESQIAIDQEWEIASAIGLTREQAFSLVFSAKEAFYKCWYPLHREFFGFDQAVVDSTSKNYLTIRCLENNPNFGRTPDALNVHFYVTGKDVFTFTWMEQK